VPSSQHISLEAPYNVLQLEEDDSKKKSLEPWIGACLRTDSQRFTNDEAMDWSFPEVSLRVPSCVLIFFHYYFNSAKMGYFTIRVSQRIPVRVQYPALIRHLCAVSLQRSLACEIQHFQGVHCSVESCN
jgi:hypothetical protein